MAKVWPGSVRHTAAPPVFLGSREHSKGLKEHERVAKVRYEHDNGQTHDGSPKTERNARLGAKLDDLHDDLHGESATASPEPADEAIEEALGPMGPKRRR